jgi:LSD1 subclass zinc finger protein
MEEVRCCKCNKLLGKIRGQWEIKCTRCNTIGTGETQYKISANDIKSMAMKTLNTKKESVENGRKLP